MLSPRRRDVKMPPERKTAILALRGTETGQRGGRSELAVARWAIAVRPLQTHVGPLGPNEETP
eukprot:3288847-Pyramimonas_sp.AAC.1